MRPPGCPHRPAHVCVPEADFAACLALLKLLCRLVEREGTTFTPSYHAAQRLLGVWDEQPKEKETP